MRSHVSECQNMILPEDHYGMNLFLSYNLSFTHNTWSLPFATQIKITFLVISMLNAFVIQKIKMYLTNSRNVGLIVFMTLDIVSCDV
ncbi:hypothetical protein BH23THE1_BH23THE1_14880 [soil metagenome]